MYRNGGEYGPEGEIIEHRTKVLDKFKSVPRKM